jgi:hypothetical protein
MRKIILVFLLGSSMSAAAVTFKSGDTTDKSLKSPLEVLNNLKKCVSDGQSASLIRACAKEQLPKKMSEREQVKLLSWFEMSYEVSDIAVCKKTDLGLIPEEIMAGTKQVVCATLSVGEVKRPVKFFFSEDGGLRLANIKTN